MQNKYIQIEQAQNVWLVPIIFVAAERAKYYAASDSDTTYQDEFDYVIENSTEAVDWLQNNMNYEDWKDAAQLSQKPSPAEFEVSEDHQINIIVK